MKIERSYGLIRNLEVAGKYSFLLIIAFIMVAPVIWVWVGAFKSHLEIYLNPFGLPETFNYMNLVNAWQIARFSLYFKNSVIMTLATVIVVVVLSSLAGFAFGMFDFRGNRLIFYFMLIGLLMPMQAYIIGLYYLMVDLHLLNTYWAFILPRAGANVCFGTFLMRAYFKSLPRGLLDSAYLDGCSKLQAFIYVMAPLAKPALTTLFIFQTVWNWKEFFLPFMVIHKDSLRPITLGLMFFRGRYTADIGLILAGVTITTFPLILTYLIMHRRFAEGILQGAIKG